LRKLNKYIASLAVLFSLTALAQQMDSMKIRYSYVNSIPQNAHIYLNGVKIGNTPLHFVIDSSAAEVSITVKLDGYAEYSYYAPRDSGIINETFKLVPLKGSSKTSVVQENKSYAFSDKVKVVPIIVSSAVMIVSGVMAYYFKSLAIEKQDEFFATGDPALIDQKKKYDVMAGVSLTAFQLGFAALLYFYFNE
jgi:hypothetical protein